MCVSHQSRLPRPVWLAPGARLAAGRDRLDRDRIRRSRGAAADGTTGSLPAQVRLPPPPTGQTGPLALSLPKSDSLLPQQVRRDCWLSPPTGQTGPLALSLPKSHSLLPQQVRRDHWLSPCPSHTPSSPNRSDGTTGSLPAQVRLPPPPTGQTGPLALSLPKSDSLPPPPPPQHVRRDYWLSPCPSPTPDSPTCQTGLLALSLPMSDSLLPQQVRRDYWLSPCPSPTPSPPNRSDGTAGSLPAQVRLPPPPIGQTGLLALSLPKSDSLLPQQVRRDCWLSPCPSHTPSSPNRSDGTTGSLPAQVRLPPSPPPLPNMSDGTTGSLPAQVRLPPPPNRSGGTTGSLPAQVRLPPPPTGQTGLLALSLPKSDSLLPPTGQAGLLALSLPKSDSLLPQQVRRDYWLSPCPSPTPDSPNRSDGTIGSLPAQVRLPPPPTGQTGLLALSLPKSDSLPQQVRRDYWLSPCPSPTPSSPNRSWTGLLALSLPKSDSRLPQKVRRDYWLSPCPSPTPDSPKRSDGTIGSLPAQVRLPPPPTGQTGLLALSLPKSHSLLPQQVRRDHWLSPCPSPTPSSPNRSNGSTGSLPAQVTLPPPPTGQTGLLALSLPKSHSLLPQQVRRDYWLSPCPSHTPSSPNRSDGTTGSLPAQVGLPPPPTGQTGLLALSLPKSHS